MNFQVKVSIPFKRESVAKDRPSKNKKEVPKVSIPFKRESVAKEVSLPATSCFQITQVSIPFKRESVAKAVLMFVVTSCGLGFNSLQTGKCSQRHRKQSEINQAMSRQSFNSLQTGKCSQSSLLHHFELLICAGFNSLQTGKCSQREERSLQEIADSIASCFNSLQTGKCSQRVGGWDSNGKIIEFQFPSNGKV